MTAHDLTQRISLLCLTLLWLLAGPSGSFAATWQGGGANANWATGDNWVGGTAPANPLADTIHYDTGGQTTTGIVNEDWVIDTMNVTPLVTYTENFAHTIDLGGNKLTINDELRMLSQIPASSGGDATVTFANGTLQLGTPGNLANLLLAQVHQSTRTESIATLQFGASSTFIPYLDRIELGIKNNLSHKGSGRLDLRGVAVQDNALLVNTLRIADQGAWTSEQFSYLALDGSTNLQTLQIKSELTMATGIITVARLGDPSNDWKLPADLDLALGVDMGNRATVGLASSASNRSANAYLTAASGGTLSAYLDTLQVGNNGYNANLLGTKTGVLDFSAMDSCVVVANTIVLGADAKGAYQNPGQGTLKLPAGTLQVGSITLGAGTSTNTFGLLELNGTATTITDALTVDAKGTMTVVIEGFAGGLTLAAAATLTIADGGVIDLVFNQAGHGILWEGDHVATLTGYLGNGRITSTVAPSLLAQGYATQVMMIGGSTVLTTALTIIPEPASLALFTVLSLALMRRRR